MFRFTVLLSLFFVCIGVYLYNVKEIKIGEEFSMKIPNGATPDDSEFLSDEFYGDSCPEAEKVVRTSLRSLYQANRSIAPSLVRLLFHDCFIGGCDASVLLDADRAFASEKEALPNLSLKGFDVIEVIKAKLENVCPYCIELFPALTSLSWPPQNQSECGDADAVVPVTSTRYSIDALKLRPLSLYGPWYIDGQVGGWSQQYAGLNFVTVRGAGHEVPLHRPKQALALFKAFISGTPLSTTPENSISRDMSELVSDS